MYKSKKAGKHFGFVVSSKDSIANVFGLKAVCASEMVINSKGDIGLVLNLEKHLTGIITFRANAFKVGDIIIRMFKTLSIQITPFMLSSVYNSLGFSLNNLNNLNEVSFFYLAKFMQEVNRHIEVKAPGIIAREPVRESFITGTVGVDALLPLGKGQRELIIGDRQTGKTAIAVDSILSNAKTSLIALRALV